jgi:hypothetical protein
MPRIIDSWHKNQESMHCEWICELGHIYGQKYKNGVFFSRKFLVKKITAFSSAV